MSSCRGTGNHSPSPRTKPPPDCCGAGRPVTIDWCGQAVAALRPLSELIKSEVMKTDRLHADDTPIKVLDPRRRSASARGVKEGRIWVLCPRRPIMGWQ